MATEAQIKANQENAKRSTGPTSPEGKEVCRRNALKHGLASSSTLDVSADPKFHSRKEVWRETFLPEGDYQEHAFDNLVAASLRLDRCGRAIDHQIRLFTVRSDTAWDADRQLEVAKVSSRLATDPVVTVRKLQTTSEGCRLLQARWNRLGEALDANNGWTEHERSLALDLLGLAPDLRSGPTLLDPPGVTDLVKHRGEFCRTQYFKLGEQAEALAPSEDLAFALAASGESALLSAPVKLLFRYMRDAQRQFDAARRDLREPIVEKKSIEEELEQELNSTRLAPAPKPMPPDLSVKRGSLLDALVNGPRPVDPTFVNISASPARPKNRHERRRDRRR